MNPNLPNSPMPTYFETRLAALGITPELNTIMLHKSDLKTGEEGLQPEQIFKPHEKGIEIIVYSLDRLQPKYTPENSRWKKNWSIIRYEHPLVKPNGDTLKYLMPKGQGSFPFFPPQLVNAFDSKTKIKSL